MWKRVRYTILNDDSNRDPDFFHYIKMFFDSDSSIKFDDWQRIQDYVNMSLSQQHKIHSSKNSYLEDEEYDCMLKGIDPVFPEFYEFVLPQNYLDYKSAKEEEKLFDAQFHASKPRSEYNLSSEEVTDILTKIVQVLHSPEVNSSLSYYNTINALQLVSGRRNYEITTSLRFEPASHAYQARVSGLLKNDKARDEWIVIPLLCCYDVFHRKMTEIRDYKDLSDLSIVEANRVCGSSIRNACKRLFGRHLTHTQKRNFYADLAWSSKERNGFLVGENSCSKLMWTMMALGHKMQRPTSTQRYQAMNINVV